MSEHNVNLPIQPMTRLDEPFFPLTAASQVIMDSDGTRLGDNEGHLAFDTNSETIIVPIAATAWDSNNTYTYSNPSFGRNTSVIIFTPEGADAAEYVSCGVQGVEGSDGHSIVFSCTTVPSMTVNPILLVTQGDAEYVDTSRIQSLTLPAASWTGSASPYSQSVTSLNGVGSATKVDLDASAATVAQLVSDKVESIYVENNNGTLTAYSIGAKPSVDITVQATLSESEGISKYDVVNSMAYQAGDVITQANLDLSGFITSGATDICFTIPLTRPIAATSATLVGAIAVRQNGYYIAGMYDGSIAIEDIVSASSITCSPFGLRCRLTLNEAPTMAVNNDAVGIQLINFTITFT